MHHAAKFNKNLRRVDLLRIHLRLAGVAILNSTVLIRSISRKAVQYKSVIARTAGLEQIRGISDSRPIHTAL